MSIPPPTVFRHPSRCIAFQGTQRIATGTFAEVAMAIKRAEDTGQHRPILFFNAQTSEQLEADTRGSLEDVAKRYADASPTPPASGEQASPVEDDPPVEAARTRGRPKLGVVAREVTLLPRHWDWLATQPGGASVALRKLVEDARRTHASRDQARQSREAAYRFMSVMGSSLESFEEATRALFAGDRVRFDALLGDWPVDVREHASALALDSFSAS